MSPVAPLEGRFTVDVPDLAWTAAWLGPEAQAGGRLAGEGTLAGTLREPTWSGRLEATGLVIREPALGAEVADGTDRHRAQGPRGAHRALRAFHAVAADGGGGARHRRREAPGSGNGHGRGRDRSRHAQGQRSREDRRPTRSRGSRRGSSRCPGRDAWTSTANSTAMNGQLRGGRRLVRHARHGAAHAVRRRDRGSRREALGRRAGDASASASTCAWISASTCTSSGGASTTRLAGSLRLAGVRGREPAHDGHHPRRRRHLRGLRPEARHRAGRAQFPGRRSTIPGLNVLALRKGLRGGGGRGGPGHGGAAEGAPRVVLARRAGFGEARVAGARARAGATCRRPMRPSSYRRARLDSRARTCLASTRLLGGLGLDED